jgi:general secretion pathway protein B
MSYILDALNKSEEEKQQHRTPSLNTIHQKPSKKRTQNRSWTAILSLLILMNLVGLMIWLFFFSGSSSRPTLSRTQPDVSSSPVSTAPSRRTPSSVAPSVTPPELTSSTSGRAQISPSVSLEKPLESAAVPDLINQEIAAIRFSSHIYASDADLRMVVINGQPLRENARFGSALELSQITEDGVIIQYQDHSIPVSVLSQWAED